MTFKRAIIGFAIIYAVIGIVMFWPNTKQKAQDPVEEEVKIEMTWDLANESAGNYKPPVWLKNPEFSSEVDEIEHTDDQVHYGPDFTSSFQIISMYAQAQLGESTILSSFVSPYLAHTDYESRKVAAVTDRANGLANRLTRGKSLSKIQVTSPTQIKENEVTHTILLEYKDGKKIQLKGIPMIKLVPLADHEKHDPGMWYLNINLQELVQLIERTAQS
ncbi:hypothetical protein [Paenibacillus abyssi]|uniref:hypothetical protein n=1 Tax=Paenibacillus abyssi TaxID=1340531 RepID=UPI0016670288|nr:hypothetical protein [Paenibacillus abyssi]